MILSKNILVATDFSEPPESRAHLRPRARAALQGDTPRAARRRQRLPAVCRRRLPGRVAGAPGEIEEAARASSTG